MNAEINRGYAIVQPDVADSYTDSNVRVPLADRAQASRARTAG